MRKAWPLLTLGIIAYAVFAMVTLPAGVVLRRFESAGVCEYDPFDHVSPLPSS